MGPTRIYASQRRRWDEAGGRHTHLLAQAAAVLLGHPLGHRHGGDTAWLGAANLAAGGVPRLCQVLRDLGGLSRTGLPDHYQNLVVVDSLLGGRGHRNRIFTLKPFKAIIEGQIKCPHHSGSSGEPS